MPMQFPDNAFWDAADDGSGAWALATRRGDLGGVLGSWLRLVPAHVMRV